MGKVWGSLLWQLDRKRKYYMSFQTGRATSTLATALTFSLCLLLYVNVWSSSSPSSSKPGLDMSKLSSSIKNPGQHRDHLPPPPAPHSLSTPHPHPPRTGMEKSENGGSQVYTQTAQEQRGYVRTVFDTPLVVKKNGEFSGQAQLVKPIVHQVKSKESRQMEVEETGPSFDVSHKENSLAKLQRIFKKVDVNQDGDLSTMELSDWINERVRAHFSTALRDNFDSFFGIDRNPRNGRVEWSEYLDFHLTKLMGYKGPKITPESVRKRSEDYKKLSKEIKVEIAALEAKFSENANNDPDYLTVDEFLSFTHPEASPTKLLAAVQDTFSTFDLDGDGIITKTEFDTTYAEAEGVDNVYKEDLHLIDADHNNQISRVELMRYMDPKNTIHADKDAKSLMRQADANKNGRLTMDELKKHLAFVVESKFYDAAKNLHKNHQLHN